MPTDYTPEELGHKGKPADPLDILGQPRGNARFPFPHVGTFGGQAGWSNRSYLPYHDEAVAHSMANAGAMRLDPVIDTGMRLRTYPTSLLSLHVEPDDDESPYEVERARKAERNLQHLPGFLFAKHWLLDDGIFTGKSAVKVRWEATQKRDRLYHLPTAFEPVSGDKLVFKWSGQLGVLVGGNYPGPTEAVPGGGGRAYFLTPEEREQMIVFQFEPADVSYWNPQKAGAIKGLGLRDKLYWFWALKQRVWGMSMDFLQWFAQGLTVYYFRNGNAEHATAVRNWVEAQQGQSALLFPWFVGNEQGFKPIERFEASTASPAFLQSLVTEYFDRIIKELILGQTLTSGTAPTGLGSGVASAHQTTFDQIVKYDAVALGECLTRDLLGPYYRFNEPGVPCGRIVIDVDDPNAQGMIENAKAIIDMGGSVPMEPLIEAGGIPQTKPGQTVLSNLQPMQPAAAGGIPQGTPVVNPQPLG